MKSHTSWKENRQVIRLSTGMPYGREVRVNYAEAGGKLYIIATGEWKRELVSIPQVQVSGINYTVRPCSEEYVRGLFARKYGSRLVERHFHDANGAFEFTPGTIEYSPEDIIGSEFDQISQTYEDTVNSDPLQRHMRVVTGNILKSHYFKGAKILELGSGTMIETRDFLSDSEITVVEASGAMIEEALSRINDCNRKNLHVCKNIDEAFQEHKEYDIAFSTFGYLETCNIQLVIADVHRMLRDGGIFIAGYWNRYGAYDLIMAALCGKGTYVRQKLRGVVPPGFSRYNLLAHPRTTRDFIFGGKFSVVEEKGVSLLVPPYNSNRGRRISSFKKFLKLDEKVCGIRWLSRFADYRIIVLAKNTEISR